MRARSHITARSDATSSAMTRSSRPTRSSTTASFTQDVYLPLPAEGHRRLAQHTSRMQALHRCAERSGSARARRWCPEAPPAARYGHWSASSLVVHSGYATAGGLSLAADPAGTRNVPKEQGRSASAAEATAAVRTAGRSHRSGPGTLDRNQVIRVRLPLRDSSSMPVAPNQTQSGLSPNLRAGGRAIHSSSTTGAWWCGGTPRRVSS